MTPKFYTLPLRIDELLNKKQHPLCALPQSIAQNIYLVITSHFGESYYDEDFGCLIWEKDFELITNMKWVETIVPALTQSIQKSERRLSNIDVKIQISEFEFKSKTVSRAKKRIHIHVTGVITKTNESFQFTEQIYISPLSLD
jgi:phage baseplate assembly protein W